MRRSIASVVAGLALWTAAPAQGTTVRDLPVEEMASISTLVVRGTVSTQKTEWSADHQLILTRTVVTPSLVLKGAAQSAVTITQVGGTLDGKTLAVPGDARFLPGEEVVVFLEPHPTEKGHWVLVAMGAAKYSVRQTSAGLVAERNLDGLAFARPGPDGVLRPAPTTQPSSVPLQLLQQSVQTLQPLPVKP